MMKKISKLVVVCGIAGILSACGQGAASVDLAQDIRMEPGSLENAGAEGLNKDDGKVELAKEEKVKEEEREFGFVYEGATLVPGELLDHDTLPEYTSVAEVPSCAFEGNDNVYDFKTFELTAYFAQEEERIYSIYFITPDLSTTEGLSLGDSVADMKTLYGEGYETEGTSYIYTRGETSLIIIAENDTVVSIEYQLGR
ncbi:MAG: hypothetical protein NC433_16060 [Clostridiales bacterium]|nr:hypothetical protein [Clostridiales bacterium]